MDWKLGGLIIVAALIVAPTPALAQQNNQKLEGCRAKLKAATQLDLVKGMTFDGGRPKLTIGPTWYRIDFGAKTVLAETAACFFLVGDSSKAITFPIYDNMTGKEIAVWKYTKLEVK